MGMAKVTDITVLSAQNIARIYKRRRSYKLGILEKQLLVSTVVFGLLFIVFSALFFVTHYHYARLLKEQSCNSNECIESAMTLIQTVDFTQDPCQDFYKFSCGKFSENHPLSENGLHSSWFTEKDNQLNRMVLEILRSPIKSTDLEVVKKTKEFFQSCTNKTELNLIGLDPLFEILDKLELPYSVPNNQTAGNFSLARTLALAQRFLSQDIFVTVGIVKEPGNGSESPSNSNVFKLFPGTTTVGIFDDWNADRSIFERNGFSGLRYSTENEGKQRPLPSPAKPSSKQKKKATILFIAAVIEKLTDNLANESDFNRENNSIEHYVTAIKIVDFTMALMKELNFTEDYTEKNSTERITLSDLESVTKEDGSTPSVSNQIDWKEYFSVLIENINKSYDIYNETLLVDNLNYFIVLSNLLRNTSAETIQRHIWWKIVEEYAKYTTTDMRAIYLKYYTTLYGEGVISSRTHVCTNLMKATMGIALSYEMSMKNDFKKESKKIVEMLRDIRRAFETMVNSASWMDEKTKSITLDKAKAVKHEIGYANWMTDPEKIERHYSGLELKESEFLLNIMRVSEWEVQKILETLGPIKNESTKSSNWFINPLQVNAYYSHSDNTIFIPAGILRTPFYFRGLESLNYGAIGTILGHELTHGFDIDGKNYNKFGQQQENIWPAQIVEEYEARTKCFVQQYENHTIYDDNKVNGTFTLAENIADNGGIRESYRAYKLYTSRHGREQKLPGFENFTHEQLLFLSYANMWCEASTPKFYMLSRDTHSPQRIRVLATLQNMREFSEAFDCPSDSFMNPPEKCIIW